MSAEQGDDGLTVAGGTPQPDETNVLSIIRLINDARQADGRPVVSSDELDGIFARLHAQLGLPPVSGTATEQICTVADEVNEQHWMQVLMAFTLLFDGDGTLS